ncbi:hypothetical protein, partial [Vogesella mureinivorans]|uniref:hypothetical protein n=1 Tax=Vogesella mureinivorans TaxID=657276 RepID=UPI0011C975E9
EPASGSTLTEHANAAFQEAVDKAVDDDLFPILHKEHSEYFRIVGARELVQVERFDIPGLEHAHFVGSRGHGVKKGIGHLLADQECAQAR